MKKVVFQILTIPNSILFIIKTIAMLKIILATLIIVAVCIALLCVKILFKKNGRFPNTHVSGSKAMRERGDACSRKTENSVKPILTPSRKDRKMKKKKNN